MKSKIKIFSFIMLMLLVCGPPLSAQDMKMKKGDSKMKMSTMEFKKWPMASQMAIKEQTALYGKPDEVTPTMVVWHNKGAWKKTTITNYESQHHFPVMHTDCMEQVIAYRVPPGMGDELAIFDGSVTIDRTQGTIAARCDKEENNMLALNLAHDIIMGKKTVDEARKSYGEMVMQAKAGNKPDYMKKLMFTAGMNTEDPDKVTTGMNAKGMK
ncbi:MAG TPA: hypothetical protein VEX63_14490 [Flavisolibacter sp.]|nr:hypothetical protein [Flavisolibacter sp.]